MDKTSSRRSDTKLVFSLRTYELYENGELWRDGTPLVRWKLENGVFYLSPWNEELWTEWKHGTEAYSQKIGRMIVE